jgi:tetratricopeptide (TPR) repeat protein
VCDLIAAAAADPRRAYESALAMTSADDPAFRVTARRALGLACKELGRLDEGLAHLDEALRVARSAGLAYAAAQVKMNLVGLLTARGDIDAALATADEAAPVLTGADADRLLANRACVLARSGRIDEVARIARACRDPQVQIGLRVNVGLARAYAGRLGRGESDLRGALAVAERHALRHQAAMVRHNLAVIALRRGDLPRALAIYDDVEPELAGVGERLCQLQLDRAETLIAARLPDEARILLTRTLERLDGAGYGCDTADALLLLAHAELADDDPHAAAATAQRAEAAFGTSRAGFAALAGQVGLRARWAGGDRSASLASAAERAAERLERAGWASAAAEARTLAVLVALGRGRREHARRLLGRVGDGGTVSARVAFRHATALLRFADGDRKGASAAVRSGLRAVDEHAAALGAAELRGRAAGWSAELAELGVRLARGPRALLAAAERGRAIADRPPAVRPPRDRRLAGLLAELRRVSAEVPDRPGLLAAQTRLEDAIRARTRRLASSREAVRGWAWLVPALSGALGDRVFVELIRCGDELLAVTVADGRCRRASLGSYTQAEHDVRLLRFAVSRLAREAGRGSAGVTVGGVAGRRMSGADRTEAGLAGGAAGDLAAGEMGDRQAGGPNAAGHAMRGGMAGAVRAQTAGAALAEAAGAPVTAGAAGRGLAAAAGRLDAQLLRALRLGDRQVVLAPAGALHGLPWAALPSLAGRALTVVPSAASWLRALRVPASPGHVALVAGPDLSHAAEEVAAVRAGYPEPLVLTGTAATADAVRTAMDGAATAHLAAHGTFRSGNALFSSLRLADGPLITYDLEHLRRPPRLLVLSACDAGRADVRAGEAVMGLVGCALSYGTATVVAGVTPVGDAAARDLMTGFHERLAAGMPPAEALAATPREPAALGFTCFGAGY